MKAFFAELRKIKSLFLANGYLNVLLQLLLNVKLSSSIELKDTVPHKCSVYIRLPRIGPTSQIYADKIASSIKRFFNVVLVQGIFSTRNAYFSCRKDVLPVHHPSLIISAEFNRTTVDWSRESNIHR